MVRAVLMMYLDLVLFDKRNADAGGKSSILDDIIMRERERERERGRGRRDQVVVGQRLLPREAIPMGRERGKWPSR